MIASNGWAALWDLDGTILDSREFHWRAWRQFSEGQGKPMTLAFVDETFGFRNELILRRHFGAHLTDADIAFMSEAKEALYRNLLRDTGIEALPGAREWLETFHTLGWPQALGSMAPRANIDVTLSALGIRDCFDAIVGGEDVREGKPSPDVFLRAAQLLGVSPRQCVVIEDSPQGVKAALNAGMKCIAVGPSAHTLGADMALVSLADANAAVASDLLTKE